MTKLTIEHEGIKVTVEHIEKTENSVSQVFDLFRSAFLGATFTWDQYYEEIERIYKEN
jgi:hypothetical protein